jgi:hypothetical protein
VTRDVVYRRVMTPRQTTPAARLAVALDTPDPAAAAAAIAAAIAA